VFAYAEKAIFSFAVVLRLDINTGSWVTLQSLQLCNLNDDRQAALSSSSKIAAHKLGIGEFIAVEHHPVNDHNNASKSNKGRKQSKLE
jgi:hypothetical protein